MSSVKWGPAGSVSRDGRWIAAGLRLQGNKRDDTDLSRKAMIDDAVGWTPLHAVAWIGSRSAELVDTVTAQLFMKLSRVSNAPIANHSVQAELSSGDHTLSYQTALVELLTELKRGKIAGWTGPESMVWFGNLDITGLSFADGHVGFEIHGKPVIEWASVLLDTATIKSRWPAPERSAAETIEEKTPKKRGRRAEWDWDGMIGELLRIADEDGLDSIGERQSQVEAWAARWFAERNPKHESPSVSSIRDHVAPVFQARDRNNQEKASKRRGGQQSPG